MGAQWPERRDQQEEELEGREAQSRVVTEREVCTQAETTLSMISLAKDSSILSWRSVGQLGMGRAMPGTLVVPFSVHQCSCPGS